MNISQIKSYAPAARRDFIRAVTERANLLGLSKDGIEPSEIKGDIALIGGRAYPRQVADRRKQLEHRVKHDGFDRVIENVAYTWFNRFIALRYMEIHDYLDHGYRVLSNRSGKPMPEILERAEQVVLPGLSRDKVIELKLDGTNDAALYRMLLVAQCNALHRAMPFLFERINDETELLLPDSLLHTDSIIRKLINEISEDDWQEVEIIGWIYQFYISERKAEVIGKVVSSEDIPAATQLFTPNWIVKYMVQNSLGRKWLETYPKSKLRENMGYYIESAEQTPEVIAKLASMTPDSLDPEQMTLLDPACGSGHILVEAYDIFKEIYLERGYQTRNIPRLILEKNLYGLDIDDRAAQLAGFALLMRARKDDPRVLIERPRLNVISIQSSEDINASEMVIHLHGFDPDLHISTLLELISSFKLGKVAGSLIRVPDSLVSKLPAIRDVVEKGIKSSNLYVHQASEFLEPIINQAMILSRKYDCVVANPPYMNNSYMTPVLKEFASDNYGLAKSDIFGMFVSRGASLTSLSGHLGFVTPYVWMFLSSHENCRRFILDSLTITTLTQLEYNAFEPACVPVCVYTMMNFHLADFVGDYIKLSDFRGSETQAPRTLEAIGNLDCGWRHRSTTSNFHKIPGSPIAYWASKRFLEIFEEATSLGEIAEPRQGLATADNDRFLRLWYEVDLNRVYFNCLDAEEAKESGRKWFPYNKGGDFRKWYGNNDYVINWENDGQELKAFRPRSVIRNESYYFKPGITWTILSSTFFGVRWKSSGFIFDVRGSSCFPSAQYCMTVLGFLCSAITREFLKMLSPTISFEVGHIKSLPALEEKIYTLSHRIEKLVFETVQISRSDWDSCETSWDFRLFPWLTEPLAADTAEQSWTNWEIHLNNQIKRMKELETENNRLWIEAYGLENELDPNVLEDQITLARPDREKDVKRLISFAIGCMMGRYSLDEPGLIYAYCGNAGLDQSRYRSFPVVEDGIIPATDMEWFSDDGPNRFAELLKQVWPPENLEENLQFIADGLSPKRGETSKETIRRYFTTSFFKDHLQTYKNRPIYWIFSSGKQRAFECLVYLHRYNEATLSRMRSRYVTPLQGKINARIEYLRNEIEGASSASVRTRLQKQLDMLKKKQEELATFDAELRHYADKRISLDLDDGVKVNYGKFGNLLAEVKKVTGEK